MSAQLAYDGSRAFSAATPVADAMTPEQKYLFDLNGFIIIRGVLSKEEIAAAHAAIDAHTPLFKERAEKALRNTRDGTPLAGDGNTPRLDLGGMLGWPKPHCDILRKMLCHPKLVPYLKEPSLWPVAMALLGHVVVVLAPLMLMVKRSGSWWAGAGLCVAAAVSAWAVRCEWLDDGGPRSVAVAMACVWLLSVAAAWYGGNAGYL